MLSLPARILDDLAICRTRAYYTLHREQVKQRKLPDMEESKRRGESFVKGFLKPALEKHLRGEGLAKLLGEVKVGERLSVWFEGMDRPIVCVPDAVALLKLEKNALRCMVFEVADTDAQQVMVSKHLLPRVSLYVLASYYRYGAPSAGVYVSLSPYSDPPALLIKPKSTKPLENRLLKVCELAERSDAPEPRGNQYCHHCVYRHMCRYSK